MAREFQWVAVDLDGTLAEDIHLPNHGIGAPIAANVAKLRQVAEQGYLIAVYTCRPIQRAPLIRSWLTEHAVPFDEIVTGKLPAVRYIDDRAIAASTDTWCWE